MKNTAEIVDACGGERQSFSETLNAAAADVMWFD